MDMFLHMNNARYASRIDLSRYQYGGRFFDFQNPSTPFGFANNAVLMGGATYFFKKELKFLQKFEVRSRLLTYNDKWIFLEHKFLVKSKSNEPKSSTGFDSGIVMPDEDTLELFDKSIPDGYSLVCLAITKVVLKRKSGKTIPITDYMRKLGYILDVPDQHEINVSDTEYKRIKREIQAHNDNIEQIRKAGWEVGRRLLEVHEITI